MPDHEQRQVACNETSHARETAHGARLMRRIGTALWKSIHGFTTTSAAVASTAMSHAGTATGSAAATLTDRLDQIYGARLMLISSGVI